MLFAATALTAYSVPAKRVLRTFTQPDGTKIEATLMGDERAHYLVTPDGRPIIKSGDTYYFAKSAADGVLVSSGIEARSLSNLSVSDRLALDKIDGKDAISRHLKTARKSKKQRRVASLPQNGMGLASTTFPSKGEANAIIILVEYKDVKFTLDDAHGYFNAMINEKGFNQYGGTGCATEYFEEASNGLFKPNFEVYGPVTLPQKRSYYGGNDYNGDDQHPEEMVVDACKILDSQVDFKKFDNDGDGYVDNVFVIYAGQGEASYGSEDTVWPHSWYLTEARKNLKLDGVTIDLYGCSNEWEESRPDGVGTFIHEFSHILGLPDLYDTTGEDTPNAYKTPGSWSVLDYGPYNNDGRTPPMYSVYERNAMGWCNPELIDGPMDCSLRNFATTNDSYMVQTTSQREFFLFENRQQIGWDKYLPGHGMIVWHIDALQSVFDDNSVNNTSGHHYVDIVEANGKADAEDEEIMAGYSFPGTSGKTSFTSTTSPAFKDWKGNAINLPITDIAEKDGVISFVVDGGGNPIGVPVATEATNISDKGFVANWNAVEGATDYLLTVNEFKDGVAVEEKCGFGSGSSITLPEGWTASSKESYGSNSTGYFGSAAPALKLGKEKGAEHYLLTPLFENDITAMSYWQRGASTQGSGRVVVSGLKDGNWVEIESYSTSDTADTHTVNGIPSGVKQIKIKYEKTNGNLALDDVVVTTGGSSFVVLDGYDKVSSEGKTSMNVTVGNSKSKKMRYFVCATDGEKVSRPSAMIDVDLESGAVSVEGVEGEMFRIEGRNVISAGYVKVVDFAGRIVAEGEGIVKIPAPGTYIIVSESVAMKAVIR